MILYICNFCLQKEFNCKSKLYGHYARCNNRKEQLAANAFDLDLANNLVNEILQEEYVNDNQLNINSDEIQLEINMEEELYLNNTELSDPSFIEAYSKATNAYIIRQKEWFNHEELGNLQAGFTKNIIGLREKANIIVYLEICEFVNMCHGLSISECDQLLELIRRVSYINGSEIPVPAKYYTIHDKIFKSLKNKSMRILKTYYNHCDTLFGTKNNLGKIPAVVTAG